MGINLNPYLHFRGRAREAMEFYQSVFGGELSAMTFADQGGMGMPEEEQHLVMHSQIERDGHPFLMGADTPSHMDDHETPAGFSVSLSGDDEAMLTGWFSALSDGATVSEPLAKAPWGDSFGMLTDKFGVPWLVNIAGAAG